MTATAHPSVIRETCATCGMVANLDPSLHTERYGHAPVVVRHGQRLRFDPTTYTFALCDYCGNDAGDPEAAPNPIPMGRSLIEWHAGARCAEGDEPSLAMGGPR